VSFNFQNDSGIRYLKNDSGSDLDQYGIVKLDDPLITPAANLNNWNQDQTFSGIATTADCHFGVAQQAIPTGRIGPVLIQGVTPCNVKLNSLTDTWASPGTNNGYLEGNETGGQAEILWISDRISTLEKYAVVRLSNTPTTRNLVIAAPKFTKTALSASGTGIYTISLAQSSDAVTTDSNVISCVSTTLLKKGGSFVVSIPWKLIIDDCSFSTQFTITDNASTPQPFGFLTEGYIYLALTVWDNGGTISNGTPVFRWYTTPAKKFFANVASGGNFDAANEHSGTISTAFGIAQSTLDSLIGDCELSIYLQYFGTNTTAEFSNGENTGTGAFSTSQSHILYFDDPEFSASELIGITPATPPP
jgi:hypothetical protein